MDKRIQVWFSTKDEEYENKICAFLQYHYAHLMEVHHFSDWENEHIKPSERALLCTDQTVNETPFSAVLMLTEDAMGGTENGIGMYQSGHQIARLIIEEAERIPNEKENFSEPSCACEGRVWSVYSPTGGVGKTTFSITLALCLANTFKKRVLYLNLENISSYLRYFDRAEYTLSDLLYGLLLDKEHPFSQEDMDHLFVLHPSGFYSIAPVEMYGDVLSLSRDEVELLLKKLKERFDYIICDFDTSFWGATEKFLCHSDKIFLLWQGYYISDERRINFERMLDMAPEYNDLFKRAKVTVGRGNEECYTNYLLPETEDAIRIGSADGLFYPADHETPYREAVTGIVKVVMNE